MNFQDLRENKLYFIGGIIYLASYAAFSAVKYYTNGIKDISGWYLLVIFQILLFCSCVVSLWMLFNAITKVTKGDLQKHSFPFWVTLFGDFGYACFIYSVIDLFV